MDGIDIQLLINALTAQVDIGTDIPEGRVTGSWGNPASVSTMSLARIYVGKLILDLHRGSNGGSLAGALAESAADCGMP